MSQNVTSQATAYLLSAHGNPWAIEQTRMQGYLHTLIVSDMDPETVQARTNPRGSSRGIVALLPLVGPITQRPGLFTAFFGGTSTEKWAASFDELMADSTIRAVVIDVDSPGGSVDGVPELAQKIRKARGRKPIVAVANTWAASAAYWLASAADELVVTPSGELGSIGVWVMHIDQSELLKARGLDVTLISAGKYKTEANPYAPLDDEARDYLQAEVDHYYEMFVADVAKSRRSTAAQVRGGFGQGRMLTAKQAVAQGMADRVASLEETLNRLGASIADRTAALAAAAARKRELEILEAELSQRPALIIPSNPPGGDGEGVEGRWRKPNLSDFTDEGWADLSDAEKKRIGKHYGYYADLEKFDNLKLPHHFPDSHRQAGKASLNGARNSLSRLSQTKGIPSEDQDRIRSHLQAHLGD